MSIATIRRIEPFNDGLNITAETRDRLIKAFEEAGVSFENEIGDHIEVLRVVWRRTKQS